MGNSAGKPGKTILEDRLNCDFGDHNISCKLRFTYDKELTNSIQNRIHPTTWNNIISTIDNALISNELTKYENDFNNKMKLHYYGVITAFISVCLLIIIIFQTTKQGKWKGWATVMILISIAMMVIGCILISCRNRAGNIKELWRQIIETNIDNACKDINLKVRNTMILTYQSTMAFNQINVKLNQNRIPQFSFNNDKDIVIKQTIINNNIVINPNIPNNPNPIIQPITQNNDNNIVSSNDSVLSIPLLNNNNNNDDIIPTAPTLDDPGYSQQIEGIQAGNDTQITNQ
mmetsp:Transcript_22835/g.28076  ORF Transcript_22835/g.28076 Transcript_22835/m.28076 type:complete len:288 (+) Transcript_22835:33-896(+)